MNVQLILQSLIYKTVYDFQIIEGKHIETGDLINAHLDSFDRLYALVFKLDNRLLTVFDEDIIKYEIEGTTMNIYIK